jgi:hypothetical protein
VPERSTVFDPIVSGLGEEVRVDIEGEGDGETRGTVEGQGLENLPLVPYADRFAEYRQTALDALSSSGIPAQSQNLVRDYFLELEP